MAQPATEDMRELARQLLMAAEAGETMTIAAVREEFGVGHDDAVAMLDTLREHGQAVELAPGEWRGAMQDVLDRPAGAGRPVVVSVPDGGEEVSEAQRAALRRLDGRRASAPAEARESVRLTEAMVQALDDEALGKLVRAGVEGSDGYFALEVGQ